MTTLAPVLPMPVDATRTRKPNRRPGSCPVSYLRPRQMTPFTERAVILGDALVADDPQIAAEVAEVIRLALLEAAPS